MSNNNDKGKAQWTKGSTEIFIKECVQQVHCNRRNGSSFSKVGWGEILKGFNQKTQLGYDLKQLKNRYDNLRRDWKTWESLLTETGAGWDPVTNTVTAEEEWWDRMKQEKRAYDKFRNHGLDFHEELTCIFKGTMAEGRHMMSQEGVPQDGVHRPADFLREGSGDSDEGHSPTGLSDEVAGCNVTTDSQPSGSGSLGKRKRCQGATRQRKQRGAATRELTDAVSVMAQAAVERSAEIRRYNEQGLEEASTEVLKLPQVANNDDFKYRCLYVIMNKTVRGMIQGLKRDPDTLVQFLWRMCYEPPEFLRPYLPPGC